MGAMVVALVLAIALVQWWPSWPTSTAPQVFRDRGTDRITLRDVQPTRQSEEKNPPPPAPLPPVVVPNDVLIEEPLEIGESALPVQTPEDDATLQEGTDRSATAQQPETDARLLRTVQPNYPSSARKNKVRARVEVELKISRDGGVQEAMIRRRWLLSNDGTPQPVVELGYGLEEAALAAARRSLFRPARANGRPVPTRKVITFTFGPD